MRVAGKLLNFHTVLQSAQCGKFKIFVSLKFHVKSIFENVAVLQLPFLVYFSLFRGRKCIKTQFILQLHDTKGTIRKSYKTLSEFHKIFEN